MQHFCAPCLYTVFQAKGRTGWHFQSIWVMIEHRPHSAAFWRLLSFSTYPSYQIMPVFNGKKATMQKHVCQGHRLHWHLHRFVFPFPLQLLSLSVWFVSACEIWIFLHFFTSESIWIPFVEGSGGSPNLHSFFSAFWPFILVPCWRLWTWREENGVWCPHCSSVCASPILILPLGQADLIKDAEVSEGFFWSDTFLSQKSCLLMENIGGLKKKKNKQQKP